MCVHIEPCNHQIVQRVTGWQGQIWRGVNARDRSAVDLAVSLVAWKRTKSLFLRAPSLRAEGSSQQVEQTGQNGNPSSTPAIMPLSIPSGCEFPGGQF